MLGIGDWYVIQTESNLIGVVNKNYVKPIVPGQASNNSVTNSNTQQNISQKSETIPEENNVTLTEDEKEVFNLINEERRKAGISELKIDMEVQNVARVKAKDMVDNNYFSHTSPTYGSPFDMMKKFGISYKTAGENIAGNSSNSGAVKAWMNSEGHRANILNSSFNYTGIGIVGSSKYGKMFVQMFIGR